MLRASSSTSSTVRPVIANAYQRIPHAGLARKGWLSAKLDVVTQGHAAHAGRDVHILRHGPAGAAVAVDDVGIHLEGRPLHAVAADGGPAVLDPDKIRLWRNELSTSTSSPIVVGDRAYVVTETGEDTPECITNLLVLQSILVYTASKETT